MLYQILSEKDYKMFKTQKALFKYVWDTRPHISELSGKRIYEPQASNFPHVISKSMYKKYKFDPNNIILVKGIDEHLEIDRLANWNKYLIEQQLLKGERITVEFLKSLQ